MHDGYWDDNAAPDGSSPPQHHIDISVTASQYAQGQASAPPPDSPPSYEQHAPRARVAKNLNRGVSHERLFLESEESGPAPSRESFAGRGRGRGRGRGGAVGPTRRAAAGKKAGAGGKSDPADVDEPLEIPEHFPYFIILVTIIDLIIVVFEIIMNRGFVPFSQNPWGGPSVQVLIDLGAKDAVSMQQGQWWRFFTPIFMHVGLIHFALNMFMQIRVGRELEIQYGAVRIVPIYFACGIFGNIASSVFLPQQIQVGASGALFGFEGVLLADLIQNWSKLKSPWKNLLSLLVSIIISFLFGLLLPGVDNFCHLGGLIMGVITGFLFLPNLGHTHRAARKRVIVVCITLPLTIVLIVGGLIIFYTTNATRWCPFCSKITCLSFLPWCNGSFQL